MSILPPHDLQLVIDYVNTLDLDDETDALTTPEGLEGWLTERGLEPGAVGPAELAAGRELREALRAVMLAHNGAALAPDASEALERTAERGALGVRFASGDTVVLAPRAPGTAGALARILVPVAAAAADGSWVRVKACPADDCQWAFYDASRNRSGRWCNMAECGNRAKVRAYRDRRSGHG